MPTRKQRRREQKSKRHEYEFVYLDSEGNELDEVPEELQEQPKPARTTTNGAKPATGAKNQKGSGTGKRSQQRPVRQPPVPSWNRALKRGGLFAIVIFVFFGLTSKNHVAAIIAIPYALFFIPFTYYIDRFAYRRWQARQADGGAAAKTTKSASAKKR
jgi:hypothetical protein